MANRTARRRKEWTASETATEADLSADGTTLFSRTDFTETRTILRILGEYIIAPTAAPVDGDGVSINVSFGIVSTDAATVGSAAMPDPIAEPGFPWLYWMSHPLFFRSTTVQEALGTGVVRIPLDIRSMRKVKPRESLVSVVEYFNLGGTPPITVQVGQVRVLLALP